MVEQEGIAGSGTSVQRSAVNSVCVCGGGGGGGMHEHLLVMTKFGRQRQVHDVTVQSVGPATTKLADWLTPPSPNPTSTPRPRPQYR